ncbi:gliding motility-associated C-terminal domain-containing protein [Gaoshiqia sp. Z1-71]|uniref:T9SS type B sorting domain-containing protein n=1 Tax=Gaoshiqia hydrogeniformans TaxID=3290090 RepID=UPI003BF815F9
MDFKQRNYIFLLLSAILISSFSYGQLSAVADGETTTAYSSGPQDQIYIFCASPNETVASLTATYPGGGAALFEWTKYNPASGLFDAYETDNPGSSSSTVNSLPDGAYRVQISSGGNNETYTAWVFNNGYSATAEISESTCEYFQLQGAFEGTDLTYYDLATGSQLQVFKDVKVRWEVNGVLEATVLNPQIFDPPTQNTDYRLTVYDRFGCEVSVTVPYQSIVPKAAFSANPLKGEAPLRVTFTNQSQNADQYQWFFFRDLDEMKLEAIRNGVVSDSIMDVAIDSDPVYVYESSGIYQVKLVASKHSDGGICTDTVYLDGYLVADTSFVDVPNVFTPNGDGDNDEFVVKYQSLKKISVKIFNRWGKQVFSWERNNIQGFENSVTESVWDGRIGGRYASPGVYYYVIEGQGRDDKKRNAHGFVHLFREK